MRFLRALVQRPGALVLMYHRIGEPGADPWGLAVRPAHFAEHLAVLRRRMRPLALRDLVAALRAGRVPSRAVVVTFDDGYADNLHVARPLLERHDVPATVFVASGALGTERGFWWDELAALILGPARFPATLEVALDGRVHAFAVGETEAAPGTAPWEAPRDSRLGVYHALWDLLRALAPDARSRALADLAHAIDGNRMPAAPRALRPEEVPALARGGLVEVGAHTVSHPFLSSLAPAAQRAEIEGSRDALAALVGAPVASFAYPHGDHAAVTRTLVREAGFVAACTTDAAPVGAGADAWALPRVAVPDVDGEGLDRALHGWLRS